MNTRRFIIGAGLGCGILALLLLLIIPFSLISLGVIRRPILVQQQTQITGATEVPLPAGAVATQDALPTLAAPTEGAVGTQAGIPETGDGNQFIDPDLFVRLHDQLNPGVVNIQAFVNRSGQLGSSAGSGFIIDENGYIVTNNHVVEGAQDLTVVFYNGLEAPADVVGTDDDSDLAVLKIDQLPEGVHPLPVGNSDEVKVGEWVIAIGNPFRLGSSMTVGIVSATGRVIDSQATPYAIPQVIQTDAAINPGNSGGPLINLQGEVIGVNAQIATGGTTAANAGVGFAIPSNIVRRVVPVLIETGDFLWPRMGISGTSVNLYIQRANNLPTQRGAYISFVDPGGPADQAGIQGSPETTAVNGLDVPVGGDVIVAVEGTEIQDFNHLLLEISNRNPGDEIQVTVLRNGEQFDTSVVLEARPQSFNQ